MGVTSVLWSWTMLVCGAGGSGNKGAHGITINLATGLEVDRANGIVESIVSTDIVKKANQFTHPDSLSPSGSFTWAA